MELQEKFELVISIIKEGYDVYISDKLNNPNSVFIILFDNEYNELATFQDTNNEDCSLDEWLDSETITDAVIDKTEHIAIFGYRQTPNMFKGYYNVLYKTLKSGVYHEFCVNKENYLNPSMEYYGGKMFLDILTEEQGNTAFEAFKNCVLIDVI